MVRAAKRPTHNRVSQEDAVVLKPPMEAPILEVQAENSTSQNSVSLEAANVVKPVMEAPIIIHTETQHHPGQCLSSGHRRVGAGHGGAHRGARRPAQQQQAGPTALLPVIERPLQSKLYPEDFNANKTLPKNSCM